MVCCSLVGGGAVNEREGTCNVLQGLLYLSIYLIAHTQTHTHRDHQATTANTHDREEGRK